MKPLKRIKYWTMNSWNGSESLAYNLKVYNVIDRKLQDKVYEMMNVDGFYDEINWLIQDFEYDHDYEWQAGFNGRSGGYLVLYKGGKRPDGKIYSQPGLSIDVEDVPVKVRKDFRRLAINIVKHVEDMAKNCEVKEEEIQVTKTVKVIERV